MDTARCRRAVQRPSDRRLEGPAAAATSAYELWPSARTFEDWRAIANRAKYALPADGAAAVALAAFENEIATDGVCSDNEKEWLKRSEPLLRRELVRWPNLAPQLERIQALCR